MKILYKELLSFSTVYMILLLLLLYIYKLIGVII